jgi:hypothetical protein
MKKKNNKKGNRKDDQRGSLIIDGTIQIGVLITARAITSILRWSSSQLGIYELITELLEWIG